MAKEFKPSKKIIYFSVAILLGILLLFIAFLIQNDKPENQESTNTETEEKPSVPTPAPEKPPVAIDWQKYNYDFVDENVKNILTSMIGNGKTAFYLPPTGYINVTKGTKYGVAFALNNPNPSGENYFEFNWTVNDSVVQSCGVSKEVAQGWIEKNWKSFGKIPQGWVDHMTVYFAFPNDAPTCNVKYNFRITKDGVLYDTKQIEFNII